jgi:hypothetical protein
MPREAKLLAAVEALVPGPDEPPAPDVTSAIFDAKGALLEPDALAARPPDRDDWTEASAEMGESYDSPAPDEPQDAIEVEAPPVVPIDLDQGRPAVISAEPTSGDAEAPQIEAGEFEDIETSALRRNRREARRLRLSWPLSRLQTAILALLVFNATLIGWRTDVVRLFPQTASFYAMLRMPVNLRGLVFDGLTTKTEQHEGVPVLVVEGHIVNVARKPVEVPRLKFSVRNDGGNEIYSWTMVPPRTVLPVGESLPFRSRLASPPPESRDVLVRFFTRRDLVAAVR